MSAHFCTPLVYMNKAEIYGGLVIRSHQHSGVSACLRNHYNVYVYGLLASLCSVVKKTAANKCSILFG